jgi:RNA polymerase sigma-70 factor, ECF subfamily
MAVFGTGRTGGGPPTADAATADALAAGRGDAAALERLVAATQRDVWRLCCHLGSRDVADDLTQETYLRAWRSLPRFRAESSVRTWLLGIARRVAADHVRASQRRRRAAWGPPAVEAADASGAVEMEMLFAALAGDRRLAMYLTQVLGLSYAEAADVCGCPIGTIRSRVSRAREDLVQGLRVADAQ